MRTTIKHHAFSASILACALREAESTEFYNAIMSGKTQLPPEKMALAHDTLERMDKRNSEKTKTLSNSEWLDMQLLTSDVIDERRQERRLKAKKRNQMRAEREAIRDEYAYM